MSTVESPAHVVPSPPASSWRPGPLVIGALLLGPVLVLVSAFFNHTPASQETADVLAAVRAHRGTHLTEVLLEMFGLAIAFAATAAAAARIRGRGQVLATLGAVCSVLGIVGFTMVNAEGLVLNALAGMSAQSAAEKAAEATNSSPAVFVAFPLIMLGELGIVGVLAAFRRAGRLPAWPAVLAFAGLVVDFAGGSKALLVASDLLVLAALWWLALRSVRDVDDDRGVVAGALPGSFVAVHESAGDPSGEAG